MNDENPKALAVREGSTPAIAAPRVGLLRPIVTHENFERARLELQDSIRHVLRDGVHFGLVKGVKKPFLFKHGAETVMALMGCRPVFEVVDEERDHDRVVEWLDYSGNEKTSIGLYRRVSRCRVVHIETGVEVGQGQGEASTTESKYISRPRDCGNTIVKMADKRAYVAAVLYTFGLSDSFTQDEETIEVEQERSRPTRAAPGNQRGSTTTRGDSAGSGTRPGTTSARTTTDLGWKSIHEKMGEFDGAVTLEALKATYETWKQSMGGPLGDHVANGERAAMRQYLERCAGALGGPKWEPTEDQAASVELLRSSRARAVLEQPAPREPDAIDNDPEGGASKTPAQQ